MIGNVLIYILLHGIMVGCNNPMKEKDMITSRGVYKNGHLTARPLNNNKQNITVGLHQLKLDNKRDGYYYIPSNYSPARPAAMALMLHGAGGNADHGLSLLRNYADQQNIVLLSPSSRQQTWDIIAKDSFDADVIFIDNALKQVFEKVNIDTAHIAIGGFSDGASYALSLGLSNGDLFTHIIAFSPGFYYTLEEKGKSAVFISHGVNDHVLPINPCSRRIVPMLRRSGYEVEYKEFQGEHQIPASISAQAVQWFLKNK